MATVPPRTWVNLPHSSIAPVVPAQDWLVAWGIQAVSGPSDVINAWTAGTYDPVRHRASFAGGGHNGYGGNEAYEYDLERLCMTRITDPSYVPPLSPPVGGVYYGNPLTGPTSAHSYGGWDYCPLTKKHYYFPMFGYGGGNPFIAFGQCWIYDPTQAPDASKVWTRGPDFTFTGYNAGAVQVTWVPSKSKFLLQYAGRQQWFDPVALTYGPLSVGGGNSSGNYASSAYDPDMNYVLMGDAPNGILASPCLDPPLDVGLPTPGTYGQPDFYYWQGVKPSDMPPGVTDGICYHPPSKSMILVAADYIYFLDPSTIMTTAYVKPPTWRYAKVPKNLPLTVSGGLYGKMRYVPEVDAIIAMSDYASGIWAFTVGDLSALPIYQNPGPTWTVANPDGTTQSFGDPTAMEAFIQVGATQTLNPAPVVPGYWFASGIIDKANIKLIGASPRPLVNGNQLVDGGVGTFELKAPGCSVDNMEIYNCVGDGSAACVRGHPLATGFTLGSNLLLRDSDMGVLASCSPGTITMGALTVENCGPTGGDTFGQSHNIYISTVSGTFNAPDKVTATGLKSLAARGGGHLFKSRALETDITQATLAMLNGVSSRCLDIPNGGVCSVSHSVIQQGKNSQNTDIMGFAREVGTTGGPLRPVNTMVVDSCWIICDLSDATLPSQNPITIVSVLVSLQASNPVTVKNCKIVIANSAQLVHGWQYGPGVIDGGNTVYLSRPAAGLPPDDGSVASLPSPF